MAEPTREDWAGALERLAEGDRASLLKLTRLINGFFMRWNAYDFRDDWEDLIQEVLMAALRTQQEGRMRDRGNTYGYLKTVARNKFVDRLRGHLRTPTDDRLPWEEVVESEPDAGEAALDMPSASELRAALAALEDRRRRSVHAVYLEGRTLDEAAEATGIPLGSLRRYLREGLAELRAALAPESLGTGGGRSVPETGVT